MSMHRMAAVQAFLLLVAMCANAAVKNNIRITVLDSETRSVSLGDNGVPNNCDQLTFDAYCRSSRGPQMKSTLLVQEGNEPPFHISCTIESKFSKCAPLPKGETFDAKREKHGLVVYYVDDKGKARSQLYTLIGTDGKTIPPATTAAVATQQSQPVAAPTQSAPAPVAASPAVSASTALPEKVKCNFTSSPAGAEITLDGKYVGSTPSEITVTTGTHVVVFSMPGFASWKRDLTVIPGSELTVSAILQKE